jgi:hypothetical protein
MRPAGRRRRGNYAVNLLLLMLMSSASTLSIITLNAADLIWYTQHSREGTNKQYKELQLAMINPQVGGGKGF